MELRATVTKGTASGLKVLWELAKVMVPAVMVVTVLDRSGVLTVVSDWLSPMMGIFGLPGEGALVLVTANFVTTYAGIALLMALDLTVKQKTILGAMMLICHGAISETPLVAKAGASGTWVLVTRLLAMIAAGLSMNWLLP